MADKAQQNRSPEPAGLRTAAQSERGCLEDQRKETEDDDQADQKNDTDGAAKKFQHCGGSLFLMDSFVPTDLARHRSRFSPASIRGAGADPLSILDHEQCSTIRERRFGN